MADISKITTLDGTTYDLKDKIARQQIPFIAPTAMVERLTGASKIVNPLWIDRGAVQYGCSFEQSTNRLYLYAFVCYSGDEATKTYFLIDKNSQAEPYELTLENAPTVSLSSLNDKYDAVRARSTVNTDPFTMDFRLCRVIYDGNEQEIDRIYSAQYRYVVSNGTLTRTPVATLPTTENDIVDLGLVQNDGSLDAMFNFAKSDDLQVAPVTTEFYDSGMVFHIPDSVFENAPNGLALMAKRGDGVWYKATTVNKANDMATKAYVDEAAADIEADLQDKMPIVAYGTPEVIVDTTTVSFAKDGDNDWYISAADPISGMTFDGNTLYKVTWDDTEYDLHFAHGALKSSSGNGYYTIRVVGNAVVFGQDNPYSTNAPFAIIRGFVQTEPNSVRVLTLSTEAQHTVKIEAIPYTKTVTAQYLYQDISTSRPASYIGSGSYSAVFNTAGIASGSGASAFNFGTKAAGDGSVAFGGCTEASGMVSHAEGMCTIASGTDSHAEGGRAVASGAHSHAEGDRTTASGYASHAEGHITTASNHGAHSEGYHSTASGKYSHAGGDYTVANHRDQYVFGQYNIADTSAAAADARGDYVEIVGNGTADDARSNARTLDWNGNEALAGDITLNTGSASEVTVGTALSGKYVKPSGGIPASDLANTYAGAAVAGGAANGTQAIPYGEVDSTSTSTAYTATIPGITELKDGTCVMLKNGVVTSASGFTIDINDLGAKPVYSNMATGNDITPTAPTRETTIFNINYTLFLIYSTDLVEGGCWINYRGYNSDNDTIGYQLRTNSTVMKTADASRYYRIFFTSADGTHWVPANTAKDDSATSKKTVNQRKINPFGRIIYYSTTTNFSAESNVNSAYCWSQYAFAFGYSFNTTGSALTLTTYTPVYIKCAPQTDGSAIIDSTTPYVQALPSTADGKIYIFLGIAYSATNIELYASHPVYYHDGTSIKLWTGKAIPTKTSELTNDSGFLTSAPVTSVNGKTGAVVVSELPSVTSSDNGKVLRVVNGVWAATQLPSASGVSF